MGDYEIFISHILDTWSDIIYDLSHPNGRSVYDAFWQEDRPYYTGMSFIYMSIVLFIIQLVTYTLK